MLKKLLIVTLLSVISLSLFAGSRAGSKSTPQINAQEQKKYQQALVELKATNLQFLGGQDNYKLQTTMQAKMTSSSPKVIFDETGQLIDIEKTPVRACAGGEIELTSYCATVVCAYTQTLTFEVVQTINPVIYIMRLSINMR
jgi:hypothetical protein